MTDFGSRHKASHQDGGGDEIDCAGLVGRVNYVDRGDPSTYDWGQDDLTEDGTVYDLDCSSIVPSGAKAIHLSGLIQATASYKTMSIRKNGNSWNMNTLKATTQVANIGLSFEGFVECDASRVIEYSFAEGTWTFVGLTIRGWLI